MSRKQILILLGLAIILLSALSSFSQSYTPESAQTGEQRQCPGGNPRVASTSQQARTPPAHDGTNLPRDTERPTAEGTSAQ